MTTDGIAWHLATVGEIVTETARARTLRLDVPTWPGHRAGQHVVVRLTAEDGYTATRSYSVASAPGHPSVELTVERIDDGEVSPYLVDEVIPGDQFEIRGPIGGPFTWRTGDGGPLLLVGGGSGLVPLMAMLRHHASDGVARDVRLLVSTRARDDVLYAAELREFADRGAARIHHTFTRRAPENWTGWTRRVDADMLAELDAPAGARAYVCGPTPFVEAVADALVTLGHRPESVRTERFGPTSGS